MVEALDARELALRRGEIDASAAWRIRVYHGQDVVHGVWLEGGSSCVFILVRRPCAPDIGAEGSRDGIGGSQGRRVQSGASSTPDDAGSRWQSLEEIDWERLMAALQHFDSERHSAA